MKRFTPTEPVKITLFNQVFLIRLENAIKGFPEANHVIIPEAAPSPSRGRPRISPAHSHTYPGSGFCDERRLCSFDRDANASASGCASGLRPEPSPCLRVLVLPLRPPAEICPRLLSFFLPSASSFTSGGRPSSPPLGSASSQSAAALRASSQPSLEEKRTSCVFAAPHGDI